MILCLDFCNRNLTFESAMYSALKHQNNVFIRRSNWNKSLFLRAKIGSEDERMIEIVSIDGNCDIHRLYNWDTKIAIDDAIANNWEIYKATLG